MSAVPAIQVAQTQPADPCAMLGPCADIRKMMTTEPPRLDFVFAGLLKGTVGVIYGQGAVGKTFLLLQAGVMITAGVEMLGLEAPRETGRVVHISREDPEPVLHHRLHAISGRIANENRARVWENLDLRIGIGLKFDVLTQSGRKALASVCVGARLCIIDTLARSHGADENSNPEMIAVLGEFEAIARDTDCAILLAHHTSKSGRDGEGPVSGRGASGIGDNARWGASLTKMSLKQSSELCDSNGPSGPGAEIGDCRDLYCLLDLGVKPNYVAAGGGGRWLRREKGGVLVPASLSPFEKPEKGSEGRRKAKAGVVDLGPRRGLSNILGNGADTFDSVAREKEAKIFKAGTEAEIENDKSWY